jgi:hypothetical protein
MLTAPIAARRSPNGSELPVELAPTANRPTIKSNRSASAKIAPGSDVGSASPAERGSSISNNACATASDSPDRRAYSLAITPARLVNSMTICEARSNFASSAARASV